MGSIMPDLGPFLHAIADPARRRILRALKEKGGNSLGKDTGLCACDVEQRVKLSQPTVSHHMRILVKAGLVEVKKQGHWRWYRRNQKLISIQIAPAKKQLIFRLKFFGIINNCKKFYQIKNSVPQRTEFFCKRPKIILLQ